MEKCSHGGDSIENPLKTGAFKKQDKVIQKADRKLELFVFSLIIMLIIAFAVASTYSQKTKIPDTLDAFIISQQFVTNRLKAPSTAKFPTLAKSSVMELGDGRFKVVSYVDSQNSFGAMMRNNYVCVVKCQGGENASCSLESLNFSEDI